MTETGRDSGDMDGKSKNECGFLERQRVAPRPGHARRGSRKNSLPDSNSGAYSLRGKLAAVIMPRARWIALSAAGIAVLGLASALLALDLSARRDQRLATLSDYGLSCVPLPGGAGSDIGEPAIGLDAGADVVLIAETNLIRPEEIIHVVVAGDTIYGIAGKYDVDAAVLALHNKLARPNLLTIGQRLRVPSTEDERRLKPAAKSYSLAPTPPKKVTSVEKFAGKLEIAAEQQVTPEGLFVRFSAAAPAKAEISRWEWDLGNGIRAYRSGFTYTYEQPGTYLVSGTAVDKAGGRYSGEKLMVDVPHPHVSIEPGVEFAVVSSPDGYLDVDGQVLDGPAVTREVLETGGTRLSFPEPGYYRFSVSSGETHRTLYTFVAPMDSVISDRRDMDWYRTQFNTGTQSNCGPASTSMAIAYATGDYVPVYLVRRRVGWRDNGATSFEDLMKAMAGFDVKSELKPIRTMDDVKSIIDAGSVAIILFNMDLVSHAAGAAGKSSIGKYYADHGGHYIIIKGYSADGKYIIVNDSIPSDWAKNSFRYGDGISMIGKNRYYPASELLRSLRRSEGIVVKAPRP